MADNRFDLELGLDFSKVTEALQQIKSQFNGTDAAFQKIANSFKNSFNTMTNAIKLYGMESSQAKSATNAMEKAMVELTKNGVDPASLGFQKLSSQIGPLATKVKETGDSVKKSNMQWTNLALVIQDLPFGFRGIQNNLPALIGGMANMTGVIYLAASAAIALYTAYDMGMFKSKEATERAKQRTKALQEEKDATDSIYKSTASETVEVTSLIAVLKSETETRNRKLDALAELKKISPEIFDSLTLEKNAVAGLDIAYQNYIKNLGTIIAVKIKQAELESIIEKRLKAEGVTLSQEEKDIKATGDALNKAITSKQTEVEQRQKNTKEIIKETKRQIEINRLKEQEGKILLNLQQLSSGIKVPNADKGGKTKEELANEQLKLRIAYTEEVLQAEIKAKEAEIQLYKDDFEERAKLQLELLNLQKKYDLLKLDNTKYTEDQKGKIALQIEQEYANKRFEIYNKTEDSIFRSIEDSYENRILLANGNLDKEKAIYQEELYWLQQMLNAKFVSQEDYEKKVAVLKNKVAVIEKKQLDDKEKKAKESIDREFKAQMDAIDLRLKAQLKGHNKEPLKKQEDYKQAIAAYVAMGLQAGLTADQVQKLQEKINGVNSAAEGTAAAFTPVSDIFNNLTSNLLVEFGNQLGNMLSGGEFSLDGFMTLMANAMIEIGKQLLIVSGLFAAVDELFKDPATWPLAIAVGIAAIAAGTAIKNMASKNNPVSKFANGGIVSGPTMGLMGEYPGAKSNPEVIAPLDKLKDLIGVGGGTLEARISGNDLLILMNKAQRTNNTTF